MVGVSKTFPPQKQVLKNIYLSFFYGAKIGIIGLNGSGKSTLLKIIAGIEKDYQGEVVFSPGYSVGYLEQDPKLESGKTVKEIVQEGVQDGCAEVSPRGSGGGYAFRWRAAPGCLVPLAASTTGHIAIG